MKIFLILSIIGICLWEVYSPLPDFSKKEFEYYYPTCSTLKTNVPVSILIFYKIQSKDQVRLFKRKHKLKSRSLKDWIQHLNLSDKEIDKILKYETYENDLRLRSSSVRIHR